MAIEMPTLHTAGLAAAEAAANRALQLSPHSIDALKEIAGAVLALECQRPEITLYVYADHNGELHINGIYEGDVDTRVVGTAEDFAQLARAQDPAAALINGNIQLDGDSATLIAMQRVFSDLDLDWEAPLVDALGDVIGHQFASMLRAAFAWSQQSSRNLQRQLSEFALEEARLVPPVLALEDFYNDVQDLTERGDRLAERVERLRLRLENLRPQ